MLRRSLSAWCSAAAIAANPTARIFALEDIPLERNWSYTQPTLVKRGRHTKRVPWLKTNQDLLEHFFRLNPLLRDISLKDVAIKGGVWSSLLMDSQPSDIDLYIIGQSPAQAEKTVQRLLDQIVSATQERAMRNAKQEDGDNPHPVRGRGGTGPGRGGRGRGGGSTRHGQRSREDQKKAHANQVVSRILGQRHGSVITLSNIDGVSVPIQIVASPLPTLDAALCEGDVDSGCVALFDNKLHFTARSAFAVQNWTNRLTEESGMMTPYRVLSYFERGFDLVLPKLDIAKITERDRRLGIDPFFSLCDGQLLVEMFQLDATRPERLEVKSLTRVTVQGVPILRGASSVPGQLKMRGGRVDTHRDVMCALRHNVREVYRVGGGATHQKEATPPANSDEGQETNNGSVASDRFKFTASGRHIVDLGNFREPPVNQRTVENTLQFFRRNMEKDPLAPQSFQSMFSYFPEASFANVLSSVIPDVPDEPEEVFRKRVQHVCSEMERLQATESVKRLNKVAERMKLEPIENILTPVHNSTSESHFYGDMKKV